MHIEEESDDGRTHWVAYRPMYFGAAGVVCALLLVWAGLTYVAYPSGAAPTDATAARGQFGDMFGLANALFSGLAFTALIFSLHMQRQELALQREELRETRKEMTRQADALAKQSETMRKQAVTDLLAAQIQVRGLFLQLAAEPGITSSYLAHMAIEGMTPEQVIHTNIKELNRLLQRISWSDLEEMKVKE
ncbi:MULTISPECIES: hypothetical protein [unclassified Acidovorax]|uniref:hypothetical protein n=1 Tax=unclassified Acidovorax TaxID=2684926 RepID=UPI001C446BFA|nr:MULTISPECIES: hypothetical protein [unclassified Acidovorax]MBV7427259.1 hypothetical protein [Acidovorax sp. sif0732]MBV7448383.1 hypothetical protein [Acidovorax sp. sif0715]